MPASCSRTRQPLACKFWALRLAASVRVRDLGRLFAPVGRRLPASQPVAVIVAVDSWPNPAGQGAGRHYGVTMSRFSMMARVDDGREVAEAEAWIASHREKLTSVSQGGCGCCVRTWLIEGPRELVDKVPATLSASTDWDRD